MSLASGGACGTVLQGKPGSDTGTASEEAASRNAGATFHGCLDMAGRNATLFAAQN